MSDVKSGANSIADKLGKLKICEEEAAALKQAARDYDQAERLLDSGWDNTVAGGASTGVSILGAIGCAAITELGPVALACWGGVGLGVISGVFWSKSAIEALTVGYEELEDQAANVDNALTKVCECIHQHFPNS